MITVYGTNTSGAGQRGAPVHGDHVDAAKPTGGRPRQIMGLGPWLEIHW
jgi:hypothetical protein